MVFVPMRRQDKEMSNEKAQLLLMKGLVGRLGTYGRNGYPLITPLHYYFDKNKIILHSALKGNKLDNIENHAQVCFEVDIVEEIKEAEEPCNYTTRYASVMVFGHAEVILDEEKKQHFLTLLAEKYSKKPVDRLLKEKVKKSAVIVINIEHISGKGHL
ncbi:pyridoxamine 5'-phosphate oxidase family protein [Metallumcola ferriviriculae]|uniref:Pyridoxamine 5'-phosphate oxidase family protein n=1 Tax=Metallumcola ferriviriculae TaxID=3039180 RepID=A0AAU0UQX9_9FIRM|nr:pyridoxamine 5'-phosphate oxidase family protein [Desulfitibacteraceae bacterium MK1]